MPVVGELVVNLKAQTASFTDSMGKTRQVFVDFGKDAEGAGEAVKFSMRDARGSMMLLGEECGVRIPRELRTLIAELPGVGAAFATLVPIVGAAFAVGLVYKWVEAHKKAAADIQAAWEKSGAESREAFARVEDKLLDVGIKADELAGKHLEALHKKLEKIDHQTMSEIIGEFERMGKEADDVFSKMEAKSNWFTRLLGGDADVSSAKAELAGMVAEIEKLKGMGADPGNATRALLGTDIDQVQGKIAAIQSQISGFHAQNAAARQAGDAFATDAGDRRIRAAQQNLELERQNLATLQQMASYASQSVTAGEGAKKNDVTKAAQDAAKTLAEKLARIKKDWDGLTDVMLSGWERYSRAANKTLEEQIAWEGKARTAADEVTEAHLRGDERIRASKEQLATASRKAAGEGDREAIQQQAALGIITKREEREQLAAIDQQELQDLRAAHQTAIGELQQHLQAMKAAQVADPSNVTAINDVTAAQVKLNEENTKFIALQAQLKGAIAANGTANLKQQFDALTKAEDQMADAVTKTLSRIVLEHKSVAASFAQMGAQMAEQAAANALKMIMTNNMTKSSDAGAAAAHTYNTISAIPVVGPFLAPPAAAVAYAAVMAFEGGGEVPGYGFGDSVPAMLTPGETVVTKALTEQVKSSGGGGAGHVHIHMGNISALDAEGVDRVLQKHAALISKNVANHLRKQGRRGH